MSYDTVFDVRNRSLDALFTDTSDILESDSNELSCFAFFNDLILKDLYASDPTIKCWVAGGCIRDFFLQNGKFNDIDLFFDGFESFDKAKSHFISKGAVREYETNNCLRLSLNDLNIDLVRLFFAGPQVCIINFDFTLCSVAMDGSSFYYHKDFFTDIYLRRIRLIGISNLKSIRRLRSYLSKGFEFWPNELSKVVTILLDNESRSSGNKP